MDFLEKHFEWILVILVCVIALFTSNFFNINGLKNYLSDFLLWTPVLVLILFAKNESNIRAAKNDLKIEITKNRDLQEDTIRDLWSVVGSPVKDADIEKRLRTVIESVSKSKIIDDRILSRELRRALDSTSDMARRLEYIVDFGALEIYPAPFYAEVTGEVMATNIGSATHGFYGDLETEPKLLVQTNANAIERNKNINFRIRRLFIIDEIDKNTKTLICDYSNVGVEVKLINIAKAKSIAAATGYGEIRSLHDFSIFVGINGNNYSGRFFDFSANHKKMIITSNNKINTALIKQFNSLWSESSENQL